VPVSFEVDTARVSLAELASMRPGYVIELDQPVSSAPVRLVCHGQTVGHGQLVAIGEQMGVRILSMGLPGVAKGTGA
jgi:type III secretion protein Q